MTSFFFRQTTDLIVYVPLFTDFTRSHLLVRTVFTRFAVNPAVTDLSPCLSQKLFRAIFFGTVQLFFDVFSPSKGPIFKFFLNILQQTKVPKIPKGLPFHVFRHYETVRKSHFSFFLKIKTILKIFVSKGSALQFL